jgi:hypothetical protein
MVYTILGSLHCLKTPEHNFFTVDENDNKIINFLHAPWLPTNTPTQVNMESLQIGQSLPFGRKWDCKWTQMEEQAVQTDNHPSYRTTNHWLNVSSGPQNSTSQSGNAQITWQLAIHAHSLD